MWTPCSQHPHREVVVELGSRRYGDDVGGSVPDHGVEVLVAGPDSQFLSQLIAALRHQVAEADQFRARMREVCARGCPAPAPAPEDGDAVGFFFHLTFRPVSCCVEKTSCAPAVATHPGEDETEPDLLAGRLPP